MIQKNSSDFKFIEEASSTVVAIFYFNENFDRRRISVKRKRDEIEFFTSWNWLITARDRRSSCSYTKKHFCFKRDATSILKKNTTRISSENTDLARNWWICVSSYNIKWWLWMKLRWIWMIVESSNTIANVENDFCAICSSCTTTRNSQ